MVREVLGGSNGGFAAEKKGNGRMLSFFEGLGFAQTLEKRKHPPKRAFSPAAGGALSLKTSRTIEQKHPAKIDQIHSIQQIQVKTLRISGKQ